MKIIMINGSPRKYGATAKTLEYVKQKLENQLSCEINLIHLIDQNIQTCKGCSLCFKKGTCYLKDDGDKISTLLHQADGVVIATPTYVSNISGLLKTCIDRAHIVMEQLLLNKQLFLITTYENAGGHQAMKVVNNLSIYAGASIGAKVIIKNAFNKNPLTQSRIVKRIDKASEKYCKAVKRNRKSNKQKLLHTIVFNIGIKPFVIRQGERYQAVVNRWGDLIR